VAGSDTETQIPINVAALLILAIDARSATRVRSPIYVYTDLFGGFPNAGLINVRFAPKATECCVAAKRRYVPLVDSCSAAKISQVR
jgi:hypothetical protein